MSAADNPRDKLAALSAARRAVYAFLRSAFSEPPSQQRIEALRAEDVLSALHGLINESSLAALREFFRTAPSTPELQRQASQEFMNLFKVPGGQYVTPYESVFRDTREVGGRQVKGLLMGASAVDVQKWYRLAAIEITEEYKDLPDHIALEMDYLAHLCGKEQEFAAKNDQAKLTRAWEMERDFLAGHVTRWIGALRDKIHEKSQHTYFRALADLAVAFTERDLATLESAVGPSEGRSAPAYEEGTP